MRYLIGLILIALPSYLIRFEVFGIPTTALEVAIYILATCYLILNTSQNTKWHYPDRSWLYPIGLFILGALIGVFISPDKRLALGQLKGFIFDPILFGFVLYSALREKIVDRDWVSYSLLAGGFFLAGGAFWFPDYIDRRSLSIYWYEINPNPNYLALILAPILALAISKIKYWVWSLGSIVMLIALFTSGSRGAFLGLALAVLYLIYERTKKLVIRKSIIALTFAFLLLIFYLVKPDLTATPDSGRISSSNNIRYEIWKTTTEIVTEMPQNFILGIGLGNYQNYFTDLTKNRVNYPEFIAPKALTPHNIFLAMWVNGGLAMLGGFVWLLYLVFRRGQFLPAQAAMIALIGHGLVDTSYFKNDLAVLFWVLLVLAMQNSKSQSSSSK